jgi:hypothetical protein
MPLPPFLAAVIGWLRAGYPAGGWPLSPPDRS